MTMENGFKNATETIPMTAEDLKATWNNLENLYNTFSKDPAMTAEAADVQKMMKNIENRIASLQN